MVSDGDPALLGFALMVQGPFEDWRVREAQSLGLMQGKRRASCYNQGV